MRECGRTKSRGGIRFLFITLSRIVKKTRAALKRIKKVVTCQEPNERSFRSVRVYFFEKTLHFKSVAAGDKDGVQLNSLQVCLISKLID